MKNKSVGQSQIATTLPPVPTADDDPDRELVGQFLDGDKTAFDELVRRHQATVRRLVRRYVKGDADAKDVTQTAFVHAFERLPEFRGEATFRSWLSRIAINLALNHIRSASTELAPMADLAALTAAFQTSKLIAAEVWQKVSARIDELPPKQRLALELRIFRDLSFAEVADIAGFSVQSAKSNFRHAIKRLRKLLPELH